MDKSSPESSEKQKKRNKNTIEETLPSCLKAPSAEHTRSHDIDEPCDDSREGKTD
ncbi:MAG: hypothetical protein JXA35_09600 [Deltaproteobacteria bacterium]|nr:hypothetical protein [Deltaproteobacteria bacterium]